MTNILYPKTPIPTKDNTMKTQKSIRTQMVLTFIFIWVSIASFAQSEEDIFISGATVIDESSISSYSIHGMENYFGIEGAEWTLNYTDGDKETAGVIVLESIYEPENISIRWYHTKFDREAELKTIVTNGRDYYERVLKISVIGNPSGEDRFTASISGPSLTQVNEITNYDIEVNGFQPDSVIWEVVYKDDGSSAGEISTENRGFSSWITWHNSGIDREAQIIATATEQNGNVFFMSLDVLIEKRNDIDTNAIPHIMGPRTEEAGKYNEYRLLNINKDEIVDIKWSVEYENSSITTDDDFIRIFSNDITSIGIQWYDIDTNEEAKIRAVVTKTNGEVFTASLDVIIILEQYSKNDLAISGLGAVSSLRVNSYTVTNLDNTIENVDWEVTLLHSQDNPGTFKPSSSHPNILVAYWNDLGRDEEAEIKATINKKNGEIVTLTTNVMVLTQNEPTTTTISGPGAIDVLNTEQHLIANTVREYSVVNLNQSEISTIEWSVNYTNDGLPAGVIRKTGVNTTEISWSYSHFNREAEIKAVVTKNDGTSLNLSKTVAVFKHSNQKITISGFDTIESSNRDEYRLWNIDPSYIETVDWEVIYPDGVERNHSTIGSFNNTYDSLKIRWATDNCDKDIEIKVTITETNGNVFTITKPITVLKTNPFYLTNDAPVITKISSVYVNSKIDLNLNYDFEWVIPDSAKLITTEERGAEALIRFNEYGNHEIKVLAHSDGYENCSPYWITSVINVPEPTTLISHILGKTVVDRYTDTKYSITTKNQAPAKTSWTVTGGQIVAQDDIGAIVRWTDSNGGTLAAHVDFLGNGLYFDTTLDVSIAPATTNPYTTTTSSNENTITTTLYQEAFTSVNTATPGIQNIAYLDALGRPKQQIAVNAGGNREHIVTHTEYDVFGRQEKTFLPYGIANSDPSFRTQAKEETFDFYNTAHYDNTQNPYTELLFENNALDRVIKEAAPGASWTAQQLNEHTIRTSYDLVNTTDGIGYIAEDGRCNVRKKITKNENWTYGDFRNNTTEEYIDVQGRTVLKRTYNEGIKHDTKYLYDDHENLISVTPPESASEFRYYYRYDSYNRVIEKKIPGKDWEYIVYNTANQPVMTQDALQRANNQWSFTKYDRFGRVAYTGVITNTGDRTYMQSVIDQSHVHFVTKTNNPITIAGTSLYYTNDAKPINITEIHTIQYYDDYHFDWQYGNGLTTHPEAVTAYDQEISDNQTGLATGSKIRVLGTDQWIVSYTTYDQKARPVYIATYNEYLQTTDIAQHQLDFVGKIEETTTIHRKTGHPEIKTIDRFTYDHMGRVSSQTQQINDQTPELIAHNTYDALGQLTSKKVGGAVASIQSAPGLQQIDYSYNVRGWLKGINTIDNLGDDLFGFAINYDTPTENLGAAPLYNGNISETLWKTANDYQKRAYGYQYDALNRITNATDNSSDQRYSLNNIAYDKNGNIQQLRRNGHVNTAATRFGLMDNIKLYYQGNQLFAADEDTDAPNIGFADYNGTADGTQEYFYDVNGNMILDENKGLSNINYNHLNLPTRMSITKGGDTGVIYYIYDATGTKLKKMVYSDGGHETETEYAGNYVYTDGKLQFGNQPEGYIEPEYDGSFQYVYQYKDHLGNIRLSYKETNADPIISSFDTGLDDWQSYGSWSALSNEAGRLHVDLFAANSGASKVYTVPTGKQVFLVDFTTEAVGSFGVFLTLVEYDVNNNLTRSYIHNVTEGAYQASFALQESTVKVAFYIRNTTYTATEAPHLFIDNVHAHFLHTLEELDTPLTIVEEKNYYPFGLQHKGYNNLIHGREHNYKYNGKELQEELGLSTYDYGARMYDPAIGRFMQLDPHADSYSWATPYNYAFNNPALVIDPDGRDGIVFGSGTEDDPYIVIANYYHHGLSDKQVKGLKSAADAYNNKGKAHTIKDQDGNKVYVKFNIGVKKAESAEQADKLAKTDYKDTEDGGVARFGNVVTVGSSSERNELGNASRFDIELNQEKITNTLNTNPGGEESSILRGVFIHEIGHNIGGNHGDPGSIMQNTGINPNRSSNTIGGSGDGTFSYDNPSVDKNGIRAIIGRVNMVPGSINSAYLSDKENKRVNKAEKEGTVGRLKTIN